MERVASAPSERTWALRSCHGALLAALPDGTVEWNRPSASAQTRWTEVAPAVGEGTLLRGPYGRFLRLNGELDGSVDAGGAEGDEGTVLALEVRD